MKKAGWIILGVIVLILVIFVFRAFGWYNKLVTLDEEVKAQWGNVENVYQRRSDLVPNLVATVKGVAGFEQQTLTGVIEARAKATSMQIDANTLTPENMERFEQVQGQLSSALSRLMVTVERYPELKATQSFQDLSAQLEGTENRIANERRKFNDVAKVYNTFRRRFPQSIIASMTGFEACGYFKAQEGADQAPKVDFGGTPNA